MNSSDEPGPPEAPADHRKGPRRRGAELEEAILQAAIDELAEVGYAALTMEKVAQRARTGKAAVYRRWPGRAELVVDAARLRGIDEIELPDTGSLRGDVLALLRQTSEKMSSPYGSVLRGLLAELARDEEFARVVRTRLQRVGPYALRTVLERAVRRGEVEPWVLGARRATVPLELLRHHFLLYGAPIGDEVLTEIVDDVYLPLVLSPAPPASR